MGGEKINLYLKIGIVIIFFLVVLFYSASNYPNFKIEELEYSALNDSALNASSTGIPEFLVENNTSPSEGQFNSSKNESSGSVAIALEKPPFID